jgi:MFS family permease
MPFSVAAGRWIGPKYWIPACMLCWGATTMAMSAIKSRGTLIALRLLLGAFEAGFVPTVYYYITTLYPNYVIGFRLGLFAGCYSIAGAFSGLIAYGALQVQSAQWSDWQILFLLEGGLTLGFAVITLLVIPAKLSTAWMLTPAEREHAVYRMDRDTADVDEALGYNNIDHDHKVSLRNVKDALKDAKKLGIIFFNIFALVPVYGLTTFTPLIIQGIGQYSAVQSNLLSVPPFVV